MIRLRFRGPALARRAAVLCLCALSGVATASAQAPRPIGVVRPAPPLRVVDDALHFLVIGDWGRHGESRQGLVARAMDSVARRLEASFIVSTGDNFYPNGVASVDDPAWRTSFENIYTAQSLFEDWFVALGNHDYRGNVQAELDYSKRSRRWRLPDRYYAVRHAVDDTTSLELFILDTTPFHRDYHNESSRYSDVTQQDTSAQRRWLDSALTSSRATWKVVVGHHHIYSGGNRGTNEELKSWLVPMLERRGAVAYFSGHEHVLQYVRPAGSPVHYFISGAGSEVRIPGSAPGTRYSEGRQGFLAVSVTAATLLVQAVDFTSTVRHVVSIPRTAASNGSRPQDAADSGVMRAISRSAAGSTPSDRSSR